MCPCSLSIALSTLLSSLSFSCLSLSCLVLTLLSAPLFSSLLFSLLLFLSSSPLFVSSLFLSLFSLSLALFVRLTLPATPNQVTNWIVRSVVECSDVAERAELLACICEVCTASSLLVDMHDLLSCPSHYSSSKGLSPASSPSIYILLFPFLHTRSCASCESFRISTVS